MIQVTVDVGYAYDMHSIALVKCHKVPSARSEINWGRIDLDILNQLGRDLHSTILDSPEYKRLYEVNLFLYQLVDLAKTDAVKASEVDQGVYERWLAKKALQEKFFPATRYQEQKFGYAQAPTV
jgi:hypothetical protein